MNKNSTTQITGWICTTIVTLAGLYFTDSVYCLLAMIIPGLLSIIHDWRCKEAERPIIQSETVSKPKKSDDEIDLTYVMNDVIDEAMTKKDRSVLLMFDDEGNSNVSVVPRDTKEKTDDRIEN